MGPNTEQSILSWYREFSKAVPITDQKDKIIVAHNI